MENNLDEFIKLIDEIGKQKITVYMSNHVDERIIEFCKENDLDFIQSDMFEKDKVYLIPKSGTKYRYIVK